MKLYNLFESVIFEEIEKTKRLLTEGVSTEDVIAAIDGMWMINIRYRDPGQDQPSKRFIAVYNFSKTKGGNDAIRAYQVFGGSKTTPNEGAWKIFRLDRIESWEQTPKRWYKPVSDLDSSIPTYNRLGDKSMANVIKKVDPNKFIDKKPIPQPRPDRLKPNLKPNKINKEISE